MKGWITKRAPGRVRHVVGSLLTRPVWADLLAMGLLAVFVLGDAAQRPWTLATWLAMWVASALAVHALWPYAPSPDRPDPSGPLLRVLATAGVGVGLLPTFAFAVHLFTGAAVSPGLLVWTTGAVGALAALGIGWRRTKAPDHAWWPLRAWREAFDRHGGVLVAVMVVAALYRLRYDGSLPPVTCIGEGAWIAAGHNPSGVDLLRDNVGDSRLGNVGVLAAVLALLEGEAFRVLYALLGGLMALGGHGIGAAVGASFAAGRSPTDSEAVPRWRQQLPGWLGLALLSLNPWTLSIPLVDENLLAAAMSAVLLPLALARRPAWALVGALAGLLFSMRHPFAVALPALGVLAWRGRWRWRSTAALVAGIAALSAVEHAHHLLAFGSLLRFESTAQFEALPYELWGIQWRWPGMLNWPLHDQIVRTPHNPFPMFAAWWLHLADHFGLLLFGAGWVGAAALARRHRRVGWFLLLWWLPVQAGLSVQESWDYPNKMGVGVVLLPVVTAWCVAGLLALGARRPGAWIGLLAVLLLSLAGLRALETWRPPADVRYFERHELEPVESPTHLAASREAALAVGWLPDLARISRYGDVLSPWKWRTLRKLSSPRAWGWHTGEVPERGPPVTYELDLSRPVWGRRDLIRLTREPPDIDLTRARGRVVATGVQVPWEPGPLTVTALAGPTLVLIELSLRDFPVREGRCDPRRERCRCRFFDTLERGAAEIACSDTRIVDVASDKLRIRAPSGGIDVIATVNEVGNVVVLWRAHASVAGVTAVAPVEFWHN